MTFKNIKLNKKEFITILNTLSHQQSLISLFWMPAEQKEKKIKPLMLRKNMLNGATEQSCNEQFHEWSD